MAMGTDSQVQVALVPKDRLDLEANALCSVAKSFRELRLQALQSDPESFSSSDFTERQEPFSFWEKRLQNPQAKTFALIRRDPDRVASSDDVYDFLEPWQGMLVLLGPETVDPRSYNKESSWKSLIGEKFPGGDDAGQEQQPSSQIALAYHIVAVYVAKEIRGKGLARSLLRSAFDALCGECRSMGVEQAICTLGVEESLTAARKTYEAMGFQAVGEDNYVMDGGREFHDRVMRRDFHIEM